MTFRIAQISDTHLSAEKPFFIGNFERVGEALRAVRPDLVLNTGDISLSGKSKESDLSAARALHEAIGLPVRFLPGNHDLGDSQDLAAHGAAVITDERRARYRAHFGADFWTLDVPGWRLLAINAQLLGRDLAAAADQENAIVEATASLGTRKARAVPAHAAVRQGGRRACDDWPLCRSRASPRAAGPAPHCAAGADRLRPRPSISRELV
jgi:3',5'-cyclic-AMP phosphodiesterase